MPYFTITVISGRKKLGTVEAEDEASALDVLALKSGFWDFRDLAASMDLTEDRARAGLTVRETAAPTPGALIQPGPVPEFVVP